MNTQPQPTSQPISDRSHAEALHVLQDIQENIRDAKRSQWNTTHYAALLYAALVAVMQFVSENWSATVAAKFIFTIAAGFVAVMGTVLVSWLEYNLLSRRCTARRIQRDQFTEQIKVYLGDLKPCGATVLQDVFKDLSILLALALASVGGLALTLWVIWH